MRLTAISALLLVAGCTTIPNGPGVMALPGSGKTFDQFRGDDMDCRQYASSQIQGTAQQAANNTTVESAVVGTAVGAAAGALLGGHQGAGAGAATGLLAGSMIGAGTGNQAGRTLQQRYDFAYQQCMYAKGHQVPVAGRVGTMPRQAPAPGYAPPPSYTQPPPGYAPPPPGYAPPPPPPPSG